MFPGHSGMGSVSFGDCKRRLSLISVAAATENARGGSTAAILTSLTSTCKWHDIDTQIYLTHLLANLPSCPSAIYPSGSPTDGDSIRKLCSPNCEAR
jgi:hypothetical protein